MVVALPFNLGPGAVVLVLDLGKLRPVVEEHEGCPVLGAVVLNSNGNWLNRLK